MLSTNTLCQGKIDKMNRQRPHAAQAYLMVTMLAVAAALVGAALGLALGAARSAKPRRWA